MRLPSLRPVHDSLRLEKYAVCACSLACGERDATVSTDRGAAPTWRSGNGSGPPARASRTSRSASGGCGPTGTSVAGRREWGCDPAAHVAMASRSRRSASSTCPRIRHRCFWTSSRGCTSGSPHGSARVDGPGCTRAARPDTSCKGVAAGNRRMAAACRLTWQSAPATFPSCGAFRESMSRTRGRPRLALPCPGRGTPARDPSSRAARVGPPGVEPGRARAAGRERARGLPWAE